MIERLNLLTWPDYISPETLAGIRRDLSIEVEVEIVPSAVELLERLRASGNPVDLCCPPDYAMRELVAEGLLMELDQGRLPNLANLEPRFRTGRAHDPETRFSVPKDWGTTGILYRHDKLVEAPVSWADFWRLAERYSGQVSVLDSPGEVIGAALKLRGRSYNSVAPSELEQARMDLLRLRPHLKAFETNYRPLLANGEVVMALGWNGDAASLAASGSPVAYAVPHEGSQIWEVDWAIPAASARAAVSHAVLDYLMKPEVAAGEARYTRYATPNAAARDLLQESFRSDPATYPPDRVLDRLEPGLPLGAEGDRRRQALWQGIRG